MKPLDASAVSLSLSLIFLLVAVTAVPVHAQPSFAMSLQTDAGSYSGLQPIRISGTVTPAPGPSTAVIVIIKNANGSVVDIQEDAVDASTGQFSQTTIPGGMSTWVTGTFTINATWGGQGARVSKAASFVYSPVATTTTTTSSSTSTTLTTTTTTTSSTSSTVPEFPAEALAVIALVAMVLVAVLTRRFPSVRGVKAAHQA